MIDVDFHCHILPCIDDGAKDVDTAREMLLEFKRQGVKTVAATSHFNVLTDTVQGFLAKRKESYETLSNSCDMVDMPRIVLGAEVYCVEGISNTDLSLLCYGDTNYLLLELPRLPFAEWIITELEVIAYEQKLVPVIAHIDRYMEWYSNRNIESLLSFEDAIFQINNHAFYKKSTCKKIAEIIKCGYPVVTGSDAHDISGRRPNFDELNRFLCKFTCKRSIVPSLMRTMENVRI